MIMSEHFCDIAVSVLQSTSDEKYAEATGEVVTTRNDGDGVLQQKVAQRSSCSVMAHSCCFLCISVVVQLVPHIEVAASALRHLHVHQSFRSLSNLGRFVILPQNAAVRAGGVVLWLRLGPEVEAFPVDVVATRSTAPGHLVVLCKLHAANWAVVLNRLAVAIVCFLHLNDSRRQWWRIVRNLLELRGEERVLVAKCCGALST
jgi:hypothetical protein